MKIIHIIPSLRKGGAERLAINICQELQNMRHDVVLITFEGNNDYEFLTKTINHRVIPSRVIFSVRGNNQYELDALQGFVDDFKPDIIHSHLFYSEAVLTGLKFPSARFIMHMHDNMPQMRKRSLSNALKKNHWTNLYERKVILEKIATRKTAVIAISQDTFDFSKENLPIETDVFLLRNAIDVKRFESTNQWGQRSERIVMTGSLVEKKGQELAIRTLAELHKRGMKFQLDLLGDGELRAGLESLVKSLNLEEYVHFHGTVDHPETYLSRAKIYLHTAKYEPFGLVILEAMASETPVVSTDGIGNRDLINNYENGIIHHSRDPLEIANSIEQVLTDEKLRNKIITKAKTFAASFSIQNYTSKLLAHYLSNKIES